MSLYILDTDILTLLQDGNPIVHQRVGSHPKNDVAITVISVEEQLTGWYTRLRRAKTPPMLAQAYERLTRNVRYLAGATILTFAEPAILRFEQLKALKLNVARKDLSIAAITWNTALSSSRETSATFSASRIWWWKIGRYEGTRR